MCGRLEPGNLALVETSTYGDGRVRLTPRSSGRLGHLWGTAPNVPH